MARKITRRFVALATAAALNVLLTFVGTMALAEETGHIEPVAPSLGRPVDFDRDIAPILEAKCVACHNTSFQESGLNLETAALILKGGDRGPSVVPKDPEQSVFYTMAARTYDPAMPPLPNKVSAAPVTPEELGLFQAWILEGAQAGKGVTKPDLAWQPVPTTLHATYGVALSSDRRYLTAGHANQLDVYDVARGVHVARLTDPALDTLQYRDRPFYPGGAAHRDFVHAVAFHPNGRMIASAGYREVKLWERTPITVSQQVAPAQPIRVAAVSPDGQWIAAILANNEVHVWSTTDVTASRSFAGATGELASLTFSPDSAALLVGSKDHTVTSWNVADGGLVGRLAVPQEALSLLVVAGGQKLLVGQSDNSIRLYPAPSATTSADPAAPVAAEKDFGGHGGPVTALTAVATDANRFVSGSADGWWKVWQLESGANVHSGQLGSGITSVSVRPDGQFIVAAGNGLAGLWKFDGNHVGPLKGHLSLTLAMQAAVDNETVAKQRLANADASFKNAEKNTGERVAQTKAALEAVAAAEKTLNEAKARLEPLEAALKAAQDELATKPEDAAAKQKVTEADAAAQKERDAVKQAQVAHESSMKAHAQSQKGEATAVEAQQFAKTRLEQEQSTTQQAEAAANTARQTHGSSEKPVRAATFVHGNDFIATTGEDATVHLWDATTGRPLEDLPPLAGTGLQLIGGPGSRLAVLAEGQPLQFFDVATSWQLTGRFGPQEGQPLDTTSSPFVDRVLTLAFSPDGQWLATGGGDPSRSGELYLWNLSTRQFGWSIPDAHSDTIFGLEFSRDGTRLASCGADKFVKVWDLASHQMVRSFEGHTHHVLDVSWKSDGQVLASAGADNAIKIWNLETGEQQLTISNYSKQVTSVQFIGVSNNIVSCSGDRTVKLHRSNDGGHYRTCENVSDYQYSVAVVGEELVIAAGGESGVVRVWVPNNGQPVNQFQPPQIPSAATASAGTQPVR